MGMGMSVSLQIWQQFINLVFQDDIIKRKQNFDVIMDDTFIHSAKEEHMHDLMDSLKVLQNYGLKISPHKCFFFIVIKCSAHTLQGIVNTFDDYEKKALKNTLLNKSANESPDNKFADVTLKGCSKGLMYSPCTLMDYSSIYGKA